MFNLKTNSELADKLNIIKETIFNESFTKAALIHSISDTSNSGGKLDWINEASLNIKIKSALKDLETGSITKPILLPGGYLILKINEIREVEKKIDHKKNLRKLKEQRLMNSSIKCPIYILTNKKRYDNKWTIVQF